MRLALSLAIGFLLIACGESTGPAEFSVRSPRAGFQCGILFEVQLRLGGRLHGRLPDTMDFGDYPLMADATFASPAGTSCTDEVAARLTALCAFCDANPAECEPEVRNLFLRPPDVCSRCGDDVCFSGESELNCAPDCAASCGDGICSPLEWPATCPFDCAIACGDDICMLGEDAQSCPADCRFSVGDGLCEPGESPESSPQDCGFRTCGDGFCQSYETALRCPADCCWPQVCQNGYRRCRGSHTVEVCLTSGSEACPELVGSETCTYGCIDDVSGVNTRCRTCNDVVVDMFGAGARACDPATPNVCGGTSVLRCAELVSAPGCGIEVVSACPEGCADGRCVDCDETCALSHRQCGPDGETLLGCQLVAPGCQQWRTLQECTLGCVGPERSQRCRTCNDVVSSLNEPNLQACTLGTQPSCSGNSIQRCELYPGVTESCGVVTLEPCAAGAVCLEGRCATCEPGLCAPGALRCAGATAIERCVTRTSASGACQTWQPYESCRDGQTCQATGEQVVCTY